MRQAAGHRYCGGIESAIPFADCAQGHVHSLLDEVPFVACGALDENEALDKRLVAGALVMHAETPKQRKCRTLDELVLAAAPLRDLAQACGVRSNRLKHMVS